MYCKKEKSKAYCSASSLLPSSSYPLDNVHNVPHVCGSSDYITASEKCQALLDLHSEEIENKFTPKKKDSEKLAESYDYLGYDSRGERVYNCGTYLEFHLKGDYSETAKLRHANFCRDRLCPLCSWRRSLRIFSQVSAVMNDLSGEDQSGAQAGSDRAGEIVTPEPAFGYRFIFVTLTLRNCSGDDLPKTVDLLQSAFSQKFMKNTRVRRAFRGYFKTLEITRKPCADPSIEFHPHLHIIFAVDPSYYDRRRDIYLSHFDIQTLWKNALDIDYYPSVDIRSVRPRSDSRSCSLDWSEAIAEVAKYAAKSNDYLSERTLQERSRQVYIYLRSISGRRLCSFGGVFREAAQRLNLGDITEGDLVNVDDTTEKIRDDVAEIVLRYGWRCGSYQSITWE